MPNPTENTNTGMHPADINAALIKAGYNQRLVSEEVGCAYALVSGTIQGRRASEQVQNHIAKIIGVPVREIWPTPRQPYYPKRKGQRKTTPAA